MRKVLLTLVLPLLTSAGVSGQTRTVGTLFYDPAYSEEGYTLMFPHRQGTVFLINGCGEVVHSWPDTGWEPGQATYLMEDGTLWVTKSRGDLSNPFIQGGGAGEKIEHRDWDNNLLWTYTWNDSTKRMHHDFTALPNGNVVLISWEYMAGPDCIAAGRDTSKMPLGYLFPDYLVELQPVGSNGANIVWEWHAYDHLIQDYDSTKANYGVVADHPELIDFNFVNPQSTTDWLHFNTLKYHPVLDMLMISTPVFNEAWIIDHSTTTAEAASHTGGNSGKGGDLLFRWGNPITYRRGDSSDQKLFFQHDTHWLQDDVGPADPYFNGVGVFNNQVGPMTSTVNIFTPVFDSTTWSFDTLNGRFLPEDFDWTYGTPNPAQMYSAVVSGMQRLPGGGTLICAGRRGYAMEIDANENIGWEYKVPFNLGVPVAQGTNLPPSANLTFRMRRYMPDFPAFAGKDLTPQGYIELDPDTAYCDSIFATGREEAVAAGEILIYPQPSGNEINIKTNSNNLSWSEIRITDLFGRELFSGSSRGELRVDVSGWPQGIYLVLADGRFAGRVVVGR